MDIHFVIFSAGEGNVDASSLPSTTGPYKVLIGSEICTYISQECAASIFTLKKETGGSSKTSVNVYIPVIRTTPRRSSMRN